MTNHLKKIIDYNSINNKIFVFRGIQIIVDRDLAELYEVPTKRLNEQVKRNRERFPFDFMFQLTIREKEELVAKCDRFESLKHSSSLPYAFTEQGVSMLSGILKSEKAILVNIQIMRAFIAMRKFISTNAKLFLRLDYVERKQVEHKFEMDNKFEKIFDLIESKDINPSKGIFFDGQIFDAYKFVSDLIRSAKKSIILIDNYIDDSVLTLFSKRDKDIKVKIFTKISKQLELDLKKYNSQYVLITIEEFTKSHDRFIIIDDKVYHFGASLKDLGKKWFAFSRFDKEAVKLLNKLKKLDSDKKQIK
ncbi:ORF6N domain-containing protein [Candidatus Woesearchaeota archaeon]|nr:ORF6N domain-containing protein [Candidatus Woesearchaeota archaeon]